DLGAPDAKASSDREPAGLCAAIRTRPHHRCEELHEPLHALLARRRGLVQLGVHIDDEVLRVADLIEGRERAVDDFAGCASDLPRGVAYGLGRLWVARDRDEFEYPLVILTKDIHEQERILTLDIAIDRGRRRGEFDRVREIEVRIFESLDDVLTASRAVDLDDVT